MIEKLRSRKFLALIAGVVADLALGLGYDVDPEIVISVLAGLVVAYQIVEGIIDATH